MCMCCICICVYIYLQIHLHVHEASSLYPESSSIRLCLIFCGRVSHRTWNLLFYLGWFTSKTLGSACVWPPALDLGLQATTSGFYKGIGDPHSGVCTSATSTFFTHGIISAALQLPPFSYWVSVFPWCLVSCKEHFEMVLVLSRSSPTDLGPHGTFLWQLLLLELLIFLPFPCHLLTEDVLKESHSLFSIYLTNYLPSVSHGNFHVTAAGPVPSNLCIVTQIMPSLFLGRFLRLGPVSLGPTHPFSRVFFFQVSLHTLGFSYFFHYCPWFLLVENDIWKWRPGWRCAGRGRCTHGPSPVQ